MAEQPSHKAGGFVVADVHADKAIPLVAESALIEIEVESKECRLAQASKKRDYLIVVHSRASQIATDLTDCDAPAP
jgi:hypothetical protein